MFFLIFELPKWSLRNNRAVATFKESEIKNTDVPSNADVVIIGKFRSVKISQRIVNRTSSLNKNLIFYSIY